MMLGSVVHNQNGEALLVVKVDGLDLYLASMEQLQSALEKVYVERSNDDEEWGFHGEGREALLKRNLMDLLNDDKNNVVRRSQSWSQVMQHHDMESVVKMELPSTELLFVFEALVELKQLSMMQGTVDRIC